MTLMILNPSYNITLHKAYNFRSMSKGKLLHTGSGDLCAKQRTWFLGKKETNLQSLRQIYYFCRVHM